MVDVPVKARQEIGSVLTRRQTRRTPPARGSLTAATERIQRRNDARSRLLAWPALLDLHQDWRILFTDVVKRLEHEEEKRRHYDKEQTSTTIVMGTQPFPSRKERDQSENAQHDD